MLRVFFSSQDIARTRVAPAADQVWELVLSLHLLQGRTQDPMMAGWRRSVSGGLRRDTVPGQLRLLLALNPPRGYFPDFLTPYHSMYGLAAGLDAVRSTPVNALERDLTVLAGESPLPLPGSASALARGDVEVLEQLTDSMRTYQSIAIEPYWERIQSTIEADRARRARVLLDGGTEGLLASFRPAMRWDSGVLEVPDYPVARDLHLDGRGLLLVPSFFCARIPVTLVDPELPPVLVYPVDRLGGLTSASGEGTGRVLATCGEESRAALAALIGKTRARVLEVIGDGCSTGEVARRLNVSAAAASQHTTVLRNAGLLVSHRDRNTVLHSLTPLGRAILTG